MRKKETGEKKRKRGENEGEKEKEEEKKKRGEQKIYEKAPYLFSNRVSVLN